MDQQRHILIVDDDEDVRDIVSAHLRDVGHRVSEAIDGISMRAFLESNRVDAVVLDYVMQGESGYSLALYAESLGIAVIMISASVEIMRIRERSGLKLLPKPFRRHQLLAVLDSVLVNDGAS